MRDDCKPVLARLVVRLGPRFRPEENLGKPPGTFHKDVKNTDRSHGVYENKGSNDKITEKESDIMDDFA